MLLLCFMAVFASCSKDEQIERKVTSIKLNQQSLSIQRGEEYQFEVNHLDKDLPAPEYVFNSSSELVATIDRQGKLTAIKEGQTTIKVSVVSLGLTSTCDVTITPIKVEEISLNKTAMTLKVGDSETLTYEFIPTTASPEIEWITSNPTVATVNNGVIAAIAPGKANITSKVKGSTVSASCSLLVEGILVDSIKIWADSAIIQLGNPFVIAYSIFPKNATNTKVLFSSSDSNVAAVSETGDVSINNIGSCQIILKSQDGNAQAICNLTVVPPLVTDVLIDQHIDRLMIGETTLLSAVVFPENAGNKNVAWTSSDQNVASIDNNGLVTAKALGTTSITVTTQEEGKSNTVFINVVDISGYISAYKSSSSSSSINGYVTGSVTSTLINRHSSEIVFVTKFEIIDNKTNAVVVSQTDPSKLGAIGYNQSLNLTYSMKSVYMPDFSFNWYYTTDGKSYMSSHKY